MSGDVGFATHLTFVCLLFSVQLSLSVYTQSVLHSLEREGIRIQTIGSVLEVDILLMSLALIPLMAFLRAGLGVSVHCGIFLTIIYASSSLFTSLFIYRSLTFLNRFAKQEKLKFCILHGTRHSHRLVSISPQEKRILQNAEWIVRWLPPFNVRAIAIGLFLILTFPCILLDKRNVDYIKGKGDECHGHTAGAGSVVWYLYTLPFVLYIRRLHINDPFRIVYRHQILTTVGTVGLVVFYLIVTFGIFDNYITRSDKGFFVADCAGILFIALWYTESYQPLRLTQRRLKEIDSGAKIEHRMVETLADPHMLQLFEDHLMQEWSSENLTFFKKVVIYRARVERALRNISNSLRRSNIEQDSKLISRGGGGGGAGGGTPLADKINLLARKLGLQALSICREHVGQSARDQVNLPSEVVKDIHALFNSSPLFTEIPAGPIKSYDSRRTSGSHHTVVSVRESFMDSGSHLIEIKLLEKHRLSPTNQHSKIRSKECAKSALARSQGSERVSKYISQHRSENIPSVNSHDGEEAVNRKSRRFSEPTKPRTPSPKKIFSQFEIKSQIPSFESKVFSETRTHGLSEPIRTDSRCDLSSDSSYRGSRLKASYKPYLSPAATDGLDHKMTMPTPPSQRSIRNCSPLSVRNPILRKFKPSSDTQSLSPAPRGVSNIFVAASQQTNHQRLAANQKFCKLIAMERLTFETEQPNQPRSAESHIFKLIREEKTGVDPEILDAFERLVTVFDEAKVCIYLLMKADSHARFLYKPEIQKKLLLSQGNQP
ncbi:hypothetical protein AAMO2058_000314400 [Amorphochlora amoebiformis]